MKPEPYTVIGSPTAITAGSMRLMRGTGSHVPIVAFESNRIAQAGHVVVDFSLRIIESSSELILRQLATR